MSTIVERASLSQPGSATPRAFRKFLRSWIAAFGSEFIFVMMLLIVWIALCKRPRRSVTWLFNFTGKSSAAMSGMLEVDCRDANARCRSRFPRVPSVRNWIGSRSIPP